MKTNMKSYDSFRFLGLIDLIKFFLKNILKTQKNYDKGIYIQLVKDIDFL